MWITPPTAVEVDHSMNPNRSADAFDAGWTGTPVLTRGSGRSGGQHAAATGRMCRFPGPGIRDWGRATCAQGTTSFACGGLALRPLVAAPITDLPGQEGTRPTSQAQSPIPDRPGSPHERTTVMSYLVIEGNVAADATLREYAHRRTGAMTPISNATVVVNDRRRDPQSEQWVDTGRTAYEVTITGSEAAHFAASARKGVRVIIAGTVTTEEYRDRDGNSRTRRRIQVEHHGLSTKFTGLAPTATGEQQNSSHAQSEGRPLPTGEPAPTEPDLDAEPEYEPEPVG